MTDTPTGYDRTPARYDHARETIDEMRDYLGDYVFALHCDATAMKYWRRAGLKGPADEDRAKMAWYRAMAAHVWTGSPDPRAGRPGWTGYVRQPVSADLAAWLGEVARPPDVPTAAAVAEHGAYWQLGRSIVHVVTRGGSLSYRIVGVGGSLPVDPGDAWKGPITLRP